MAKDRQEIELYEGHTFVLPAMPYERSISGFNKTPEYQKWERNPLPQNWLNQSEEQQEKFILEEYRRRKEGYWFIINGVPTYITGHHYFYMNWCKFPFGYPEYRDVDRRSFYFWQLCEDDENCLGEIQLKFRRRGATSQGEAIIINRATLTKDSNYGIISKTREDAQGCFNEIVDLIRGLPDFFQPMMSGKERPKKEIHFARPSETFSISKTKISQSLELNTRIDHKATVMNAYDGHKLKGGLFDEGAKMLEANFASLWDIHRPCFMVGKKIIGKCYLPSTVNEMEEAGGKAFKKVWDNSDPKKKDANGRTVSGLYRYFVPAYDGLEGFIDEYGMSMIKEARKYIENDREAVENDMVMLNEKKRMFPMTEMEALRTETKYSQYDVERLYAQMEFNHITITERKSTLVRGNFVWENGVRDTKVIWKPDNRGNWNIAWLQPNDNQKRKTKNGWGPGRAWEGNHGLDPYDHNLTSEQKHSNAASSGLLRFDPMRPDISNMFVSDFCTRPATPEQMYEMMLMQQIFYGWEILVESNKPGAINYFRLRGYQDYLMERPEQTHTEYSASHQKSPGIPLTGDEARGALIMATQSYIYNNVGFDDDGEMQKKCLFNDIIEDWLKFDLKKWTDYDRSVAAGLAILGSRKALPKEKRDQKVFPMVQKYDNSGMRSKAI